MTEPPDWGYFRDGGTLPDEPVRYLRTWRGVVEALNVQAMTWVPIDSLNFSLRIEKGDVDLKNTTREEIEAELGRAIPTAFDARRATTTYKVRFRMGSGATLRLSGDEVEITFQHGTRDSIVSRAISVADEIGRRDKVEVFETVDGEDVLVATLGWTATFGDWFAIRDKIDDRRAD